MKDRIYGYCFRILVKKAEHGYVAYAPGVGGVYEEGTSVEEARDNAFEAACAILETRFEQGDLITEDNEFLKILRKRPDLSYISRGVQMRGAVITTFPCEPRLRRAKSARAHAAHRA